MSELKIARSEPVEIKGWLFKWTNYIKGYQKRWFVLSNGLLSYYRFQAEMEHTCRGTISIHGAVIRSIDSCTFYISNGGAQTFYLRATTEVERQKWVTALELAKAKADVMESDEEDNYDEVTETAFKSLENLLDELQTSNELIVRHGEALQKALSKLTSSENQKDITTQIKSIRERATLFRITSTTMINTSSKYLDLAQMYGKKCAKLLQQEREKRIQLEEMVEQMAREQTLMEQAANQQSITGSLKSEEDDEGAEFYDAADTADSLNPAYTIETHLMSQVNNEPSSLDAPPPPQLLTSANVDADLSGGSSDEADEGSHVNNQSGANNTVDNQGNNTCEKAGFVLEKVRANPWTPGQPRRKRIKDRPNYPFNVWGVMKNCIGKDLSKIPMPVNFSEPLSMLQRLTEDFEYAQILDKAATCTDMCEQLAYVAAFTISSYATTSNRTGKPFNPLLGESFECDRKEDLGWKCISEQVSHHPPKVAQFCEGESWKSWQEFTMVSKFRGKYLQIVPLGITHLEFKTGDHYTWRKVTTTVHNIIVGKLWVDQHGDMEIVNHKDNSVCHLSYLPYSYFARDQQRRVKGQVKDKNGTVKWLVDGCWDTSIRIAPVIQTEGAHENNSDQPGTWITAWERVFPPEESSKYYNMTEFACQLNEMEDGIAPTDSRNRPDQRLMEEGLWDAANIEKVRLEEKQRSVRKQREKLAEEAAAEGKPVPEYEPVWFRKVMDKYTGDYCYMYNDEYWKCKQEQDWSRCPDIF
ncbi:unnamed protein product [Bemisia tabaci]|uniref:PH domain-containing protein n=1 Tax=Bemisia tabaci TaxID=7038 RepID=A0A9P0F7X6_BEMTA|nr:unnamed protein product [Bemisia tabaci]